MSAQIHTWQGRAYIIGVPGYINKDFRTLAQGEVWLTRMRETRGRGMIFDLVPIDAPVSITLHAGKVSPVCAWGSSLSRVDACDDDRTQGSVYCERHNGIDATQRYMESVLASQPEEESQ